MGSGREKEPAKALLIVYILQILRETSDAAHPLSQQRILELLAERYGMTAERKAVRRNLLRLQEAGFPLHCRETQRVTKGKRGSVSLDWYWEHALSPEDAALLTDALQFTPVREGRTRQIAETLAAFTSRYETADLLARTVPRAEAAERLSRQKPLAALLARAIAEKKKILCWSDHFEADGKWHHDRDGGGQDRRLKMNPYALFGADGQYFLLGNLDGEEAVRMYRVGRLSGVEVTDEAARPQKSLAALEGGVWPAQFLEMGEEAYFGSPERCTFDMAPEALTSLMETFGRRARVLSATINSVQAEAEAVPDAAAAWALRQGGRVKVTGPPHLVRAMKETAAAMAKLYGGAP